MALPLANALEILLGFGAWLAFVAILYAASAYQRRVQRRNIEDAARRCGGRVEEGSRGRFKLVYELAGRPARLTFLPGAKKKPSWTRLDVELPGASGNLHVAPEELLTGLSKLFGTEDIRTGDRTFDDAYLVQGRPVAWVKEVLDRETRRLLCDVRRARLDLTAGGLMRLSVSGNLLHAGDRLEAFMRQGEQLARRLMDLAKPAIAVREVRTSDRCPVCADGVAESLRRCGTCETPHHAECWNFIGGCAVFGCGEAPRRGRERAAPEKW